MLRSSRCSANLAALRALSSEVGGRLGRFGRFVTLNRLSIEVSVRERTTRRATKASLKCREPRNISELSMSESAVISIAVESEEEGESRRRGRREES